VRKTHEKGHEHKQISTRFKESRWEDDTLLRMQFSEGLKAAGRGDMTCEPKAACFTPRSHSKGLSTTLAVPPNDPRETDMRGGMLFASLTFTTLR
jgi:hypothetical protein